MLRSVAKDAVTSLHPKLRAMHHVYSARLAAWRRTLRALLRCMLRSFCRRFTIRIWKLLSANMEYAAASVGASPFENVEARAARGMRPPGRDQCACHSHADGEPDPPLCKGQAGSQLQVSNGVAQGGSTTRGWSCIAQRTHVARVCSLVGELRAASNLQRSQAEYGLCGSIHR